MVCHVSADNDSEALCKNSKKISRDIFHMKESIQCSIYTLSI